MSPARSGHGPADLLPSTVRPRPATAVHVAADAGADAPLVGPFPGTFLSAGVSRAVAGISPQRLPSAVAVQEKKVTPEAARRVDLLLHEVLSQTEHVPRLRIVRFKTILKRTI